MARSFIGLDLGTSYTRIWTSEHGVILREPTAAAIDGQSQQIVALGAEARKMLGKTPAEILAYRPIKYSVVSDFQVASLMLEAYFTNTEIRTTFRRPSVLLAAPYGITEVEQLAAENAVIEAGARAVGQIPAIYAAAVGAGLRVRSPRGCMIVCIGAGVSEVAVISSGGIISAKSSRLAGERFDVALINRLRSTHELLIGDTAAEEIKLEVGSALPGARRESIKAYGRHARTGMGAVMDVTSDDVSRAIYPCVAAIARLILTTLEGVPPEISGDIHSCGLMLCGGSAALPGIGRAIAQETGLRVTIAHDPADCVIRGLGRIILDNRLWDSEIRVRTRLLF